MIFTIPKDQVLYPTLGPQVCDFAEQNLIFGPGDLRGQPLVLDEERRMWLYSLYEVYPKGHPQAGRRRFQRAAISAAKGKAKTEFAAILAALELHPEAPVRCDGFTKKGDPIGCPVRDPYIPLIAYTEEQSDELVYGALRAMLGEGPLKDDFDVGLERIMRRKGDGAAVSLSMNPSARDGARTTFSVFDETHRMMLRRHLQTHQTMINNLPKRWLAQGWMFEATTAFEPGTGSIAEATMEYARMIDAGQVTNASFFFYHCQASDHHDLTTESGVRDAIIEASGPAAAAWRDIDGILNVWRDPTGDKAYFERVWLNRLVKGGSQAFDVTLWTSRKRADYEVKPGALVALGFDGGQSYDSTAIVATEIDTGFQWVAGLWERPLSLRPDDEWLVPGNEVDETIRALFKKYKVWRLYADPPYWQSWIAEWVGEFGKERVAEWITGRTRQMSAALENYRTSMIDGSISHDGNASLTRHIGNARRKDLNWTDENGKPMWLIQKDRDHSPNKIDLAMASCLSWECRTDAIAAGAGRAPDYTLLIVGGRR